MRDGIAELLAYARSIGMPLAIEPLHPMYAADRACINTLERALDLCEELDPRITAGAAPQADLGVALGEVEIFSTGNWWRRDHGEVLDTCIARQRTAV